ncbi:MAG: GNAT family N-acetyltransferase [Eubacteriales bacterium]|nr:GNAT family N-acetyltransferase [Eubacteriales bacterium]
MKTERLSKEDRQKTRSLYEEVFTEDSAEFVQYYYQNKTPFNEIFAAREDSQICGMAHLNPYLLVSDKKEIQGAYLVAVATKKEFRHRGIMTALLKEIFDFLYEKRYPFLYLMPASEAIYTPFDFRFFYTQRQKTWQTGCVKQKSKSMLSLREVQEKDLIILSRILNEILSQKYRLFASRTPDYLRDLNRELRAMNGKMIGIWHGEECVGSFQLIQESETMILEPLFKEEYRALASEKTQEFLERECPNETIKIAANDETKKEKEEESTGKPWMMARIIHLESWVSNLKSEKRKVVQIHIKDRWIAKNEGWYEIIVEKEGGTIRKIEQRHGIASISIADLPQLFKTEDPMADAFLNEWV